MVADKRKIRKIYIFTKRCNIPGRGYGDIGVELGAPK
jgi:hypothetical protein